MIEVIIKEWVSLEISFLYYRHTYVIELELIGRVHEEKIFYRNVTINNTKYTCTIYYVLEQV